MQPPQLHLSADTIGSLSAFVSSPLYQAYAQQAPQDPATRAQLLREVNRESALFSCARSIVSLVLITTLVIGALGVKGTLDGVVVGSVNLTMYTFTAIFLLCSSLKNAKDQGKPPNWKFIVAIIVLFAPILIAHACGAGGVVSGASLGLIPIVGSIIGVLACCTGCCCMIGGVSAVAALRGLRPDQ